jgi:putative aldouronate transport system substrate-binding protein
VVLRMVRSAVIILLVSSCILAGCTSPSSKGHSKASDGGASSVSIYSFDRQDYSSRPDRVLDEIERRTETQISLQTGSWEDTQLDILMATGSYPDVLTIVDNEKTGRFNKWVKEGKIIPFDDALLEKLPNLRKLLNDPHYQELRIDGQFYGIPLQDELPTGSVGQHVLMIRQDWLDALGLSMPDTLEQLKTTLIAFRDNDPDGNDVKDTYGLISNGLTSIVRNIIGAWGLPVDVRSTGFLQVGDRYEYWAVQPEVKEALRYVQDLYRSQLIQPFTLSAATNVQVRPKFIEGRVGAMFDNANFEEFIKKQEQLRRNFPNARLTELSALAGPEGKRGYSTGSGFWGYTVITDKAKDIEAAARVLDFLLSDEGNRLTLYGVPGVHYTETNGRSNLSLEERKRDIGFGSVHPEAAHELNWGIVSWSRMTEDDYVRFRESTTPGFAEVVSDNLARINRYLIEPASYNLMTSKWISFKSNSDELTREYFDKIIMEDLDVDATFDKFVNKWMESGGAEAMREMSDALAARSQ